MRRSFLLSHLLPLAVAVIIGYLLGAQSRQEAALPAVRAAAKAHPEPAAAAQQVPSPRPPGDDSERAVAEEFAALAGAPPAEALAAAMALPNPLRNVALRTLLSGWIDASLASDEEKMRWKAWIAEEPDSLKGLTSVLGNTVLAAFREPWLHAFHDHPERSSIFATLAGLDEKLDPDSAAQICKDWLPWEQAAFQKEFRQLWVLWYPDLALAWSRQAGVEDAELLSAAMLNLGGRSLAAVEQIYAGSESPAERLAAVKSIAQQKAFSGTREAIAWADSLQEGPEKDAAHAAIFDVTPRGVGANIASGPDGLPVVQGLIPDAPLAAAGFLTGDLLVGMERSDGAWEGFTERPLEEVTGSLRGEPGSQITVVAMRRDPATGQWREIRAAVTRQQLVMGE